MNQVTHQQVSILLALTVVPQVGSRPRMRATMTSRCPLLSTLTSNGPNYPRLSKQASASAVWPCKTRTMVILAVAVVAVILSAHVRTVVLAMDVAVVVVVRPLQEQ